MNFSTKFRLLRAKSGLTQAEIANNLGITGRAVGAWESGRSKPRLDKTAEIAVLFDTTVADLMGEDATEAAISGASRMVPLLGFAHMGEPCDEGTLADEVEVPASIADAHPRGIMAHAQGGCMDNRFPHDALLLVDPDMEPVNGQPVPLHGHAHGGQPQRRVRRHPRRAGRRARGLQGPSRLVHGRAGREVAVWAFSGR